MIRWLPSCAARQSAASTATNHEELRDAAIDLAAAQQIVGLDRWRSFLADAQKRADNAAQSARLNGNSGPARDLGNPIRPVYPIETAIGIAAAGLSGGIAAAGRAAIGAVLRQFRPRPTSGETPASILLKDGNPIGVAGSDETIRELPGGEKAAEELFARLSNGGTDVTPPRYPGAMMETPDGSRIGYRPISRSGPPTIDVRVPGVKIRKLKFVGN